MKTYPLASDHGCPPTAFEIGNTFVTPGGVARLLDGVEGVTGVRRRRLFSSPADVHVTFEYLGTPFIVWEPFGDSSRYWIGPSDADAPAHDVTPIEAAFRRRRWPLGRLLASCWPARARCAGFRPK